VCWGRSIFKASPKCSGIGLKIAFRRFESNVTHYDQFGRMSNQDTDETISQSEAPS